MPDPLVQLVENCHAYQSPRFKYHTGLTLYIEMKTLGMAVNGIGILYLSFTFQD